MALRAVVVGGGIGGVAAAVALARAGIDVEVHEQARQLTEVGAGVSLAPNGLRILDRLGVGDGIRRLGSRYAASQLRLPDGQVVRHEPYQFAMAGQNVGIHRADLGQLPRLLVHLDADPGPRQRHRRRDPADPPADHHRPQSHALLLSERPAPSPAPLRAAPLRAARTQPGPTPSSPHPDPR